LSNSWQLVKASAKVLRADKELLLFPMASLIGSLIVMASFAIPFVAVEATDSKIAMYILAFLFYFVMYFVVIFFNTALVGAALIRMRGGDPTLKDGLSIAFSRIGIILSYAAISATVGMILRMVRDRNNIVSQIVASMLEFAWGVATYLVIPILVVENVGPIEAIKRSTAMLKRTWGEQLVGSFSISLVFGVIGVVSLLIAVPLVILFASISGPLAIVVVIFLVIYLVVLSLISSALSGIYTAAVYRFAAENVVSEQFDPQFIRQAFATH
jgi:hypothetical protein